MRILLFYLDVFPHRPHSGNPAAVCLLSSWLDDKLLLKVAAENNLSATAFLVPEGKGYELRWFTRVCELHFCGHATVASAYVVLNLLRPELERVEFSTRHKGILVARKDSDCLAMDFPALFAKVCTDVPERLFAALGSGSRPGEVLEVNQVYVAVFDSQSAVADLRPNAEILQQLHPNAVSVTAPGTESDFVSRYFAPGYGIPEDPVTGSAHCFLTPYWSQRLGKSRLYARQLSQRGGELWCEMAGERVILKGRAVLTLQGELEI